MPLSPTRTDQTHAPTCCPSCGAPLRLSLSARHSIGPGHTARVVQVVTVMFVGVVALLGLKASAGGWGLGYFVLGAAIVVAAAGYGIASLFPRSWRPRCGACGWETEIRCR
ncbi:MAG: hypothetical protein KDB80_18385 [Planctomycetes bacterium]|nr:hypothetical protein [Planctomycetota bacterium]